jgi:hypothetical protein
VRRALGSGKETRGDVRQSADHGPPGGQVRRSQSQGRRDLLEQLIDVGPDIEATSQHYEEFLALMPVAATRPKDRRRLARVELPPTLAPVRVLLEEMHADHYGRMLAGLVVDHADLARAYYLDVPWAETLRRHASKPQAAEYGESEMRDWYRERDLLPGGLEQIVPASSSLDETVRRILADTGLGSDRESARS